MGRRKLEMRHFRQALLRLRPGDSNAFRSAVQAFHVTPKYTWAYRPQTNRKAERFIQSALREWA